MKKQIIRVSPFQNAKVMAVLYLVLSIPFALMMMLMPTGAGMMSWWLLILMPVLYLVIGFIFTLIGSWVYNLVAGQVGGFEFTTAEVPAGDKIA
ncbi:MAG: hypothetical protein M3Y65_00450 [Pseudomonadota bacterium]|nr:hypothetical protein [Pseudomonadota bacterium]